MNKVSKETILNILAVKSFVIAGVSRSENKFGTMVYRDLKKKGYHVQGLNPHMDILDGDRVAKTIDEVEKGTEAMVTVVSPDQTVELVKAAHKAGILKIWMQPGSENAEAITWAQEQGMQVVWGQCMFMHAGPVTGLHKVHRGFAKIFGALP